MVISTAASVPEWIILTWRGASNGKLQQALGIHVSCSLNTGARQPAADTMLTSSPGFCVLHGAGTGCDAHLGTTTVTPIQLKAEAPHTYRHAQSQYGYSERRVSIVTGMLRVFCLT
ncbi:hypothetical protein E2C01_088418 [Portunus trituberculatus]|uniref:Uncharacterized protein n=1 Tax=Portunus trituberculatus TaxID=210409 RepID=A0A5B7JLV3_PORTR|nr:hypothetical protein [Portunus trituberculatus]